MKLATVIRILAAMAALSAGLSPAAGAAETRPAGMAALTAYIDPADDPKLMDEQTNLQRAAEAAGSPERRASAHLELANWLLSVPTVRPATRVLLGIAASSDYQALGAAGDAAQEQLRLARGLLKPELANVRKLRSSASVLEGFAKVFSAVGKNSRQECAPCSTAAVNLAIARESSDPQVAAAALLWQSFAWYLAGRQERVLTTLPEALKPAQELPFDLMSRLLRCRILADGGQPEAALALVIRIGALCEEWFPDQPAELLASQKRLIALMQYRIALSWREKLAGKGGALEQLDRLLTPVRKSLEGKPEIYLLQPAVPVVIAPPAARSAVETRPVSAKTAPAATLPADK